MWQYVENGATCKMELLLLQTTNRVWCVAYQKAAIRMTFSDLQGNLSAAYLAKCDFLIQCADKISTDIVHRTVPL